jgi:hypothetical protein
MLRKLHATHEIKEIPFSKVPVFYVPQFTASMSKLLTVTSLRKLWKHLPALMRIQDPVLLFATETHGYSLDVLLDRTGHQSAFLVLKTSAGSILGVFLHWREGLARHAIGEDSFVFTLSPKLSCYHFYLSDPSRWGQASSIQEEQGSDQPPTLARGVTSPHDTRLPSSATELKRSSASAGLRVHVPEQKKNRRSSEKQSSRLRVAEKADEGPLSAPVSPTHLRYALNHPHCRGCRVGSK